MRDWYELGEQVRALANRIDDLEEQEIIDGSLGDKVGTILVFDQECNKERLVLRLNKLVDEMLADDLDERSEDEGVFDAKLNEWAQLFRRLAKRIEAKINRLQKGQ